MLVTEQSFQSLNGIVNEIQFVFFVNIFLLIYATTSHTPFSAAIGQTQ